MSTARPAARAVHAAGDDLSQTLRQLGARAHQLRAATRAADHFNESAEKDDHNTGSWLMSCALTLAQELTVDIDDLARSAKEAGDGAAAQRVAPLRVRAHQLYAAARAADHFLDQDGTEDRETGGWLVATALNLAGKLASEFDDSVAVMRRGGAERVVEVR
jgi:hypothetical protein